MQKLTETQKEILTEQWVSLVSDDNDFRYRVVAQFSTLGVDGLLMHCFNLNKTGVGKTVLQDQVANLAVIMSPDVSGDVKGSLSAKPNSDGEKILNILKEDKDLLFKVVPLLTAYLAELHRYLYREARGNRDVVRKFIYVPSN